MTEELRQALDLYKIWVTRFHFFKDLTAESWYNFYIGENLSTEEKTLIAQWEQSYSDPLAALNRAHNYIYTLIEENRESELPEDIRQLIDEWNNQ
jgi:hypothetical protein